MNRRLLILFLAPLILLFYRASSTKSSWISENINDTIFISSIYNELSNTLKISEDALRLSIKGFAHLKQKNLLKNDSLISIIDFSKPSYEERLYIIDLKNRKTMKKSLVAHGINSGIVYAKKFSNQQYSNKSSLGLYLTLNTYEGKHGYSLRLEGMDKNINNNVKKRAIVVHGAKYANEKYIKENGRLGRSFGCPAIPEYLSKEIIDLIKEGSCLFIYHPSIRNLKSHYSQGIQN